VKPAINAELQRINIFKLIGFRKINNKIVNTATTIIDPKFVTNLKKPVKKSF
jgi:hypothetical protein